ncbi:MAG: F420-dependent NADP reductase [Methanonatronarchaeales archaeon]|nr:F420-dependent NADP reductase [Methanonatronarchaeales archaeon]
MRIALTGGTGNIGEGIALRLADSHEIVIGSRFEEKAEEKAEEYLNHLDGEGVPVRGMTGAVNRQAVDSSELVVLTVPYRFLGDLLDDVIPALSDQVVVSPVVPMERRGNEFVYAEVDTSAAEEVESAVPDGCPVISAFHTLSAIRLKDVSAELSLDVVICGDDGDAKNTVFDLVEDMDNLAPWDGGSLRASALAESVTPLLLNLGSMNSRPNLGVRFV